MVYSADAVLKEIAQYKEKIHSTAMGWKGEFTPKRRDNIIISIGSVVAGIFLVLAVEFFPKQEILGRIFTACAVAVAFAVDRYYASLDKRSSLEKALCALSGVKTLDDLPEIEWKEKIKKGKRVLKPFQSEGLKLAMTSPIMSLKEDGKIVAVAFEFHDDDSLYENKGNSIQNWDNMDIEEKWKEMKKCHKTVKKFPRDWGSYERSICRLKHIWVLSLDSRFANSTLLSTPPFIVTNELFYGEAQLLTKSLELRKLKVL